jgi:hypothetical protein
VGKRNLLTEEQLKSYLRGNVSGKCFHYQIYRTLKKRGPSTANDIIQDWKERLPRMGSSSINSITQRLARVAWIEGDYSKQRVSGTQRQVIWRLNLSKDFYDEVKED